MAFAPLAPSADVERRLRRMRLLRRVIALVVAAVVIAGVMRTWQSVAGKKTTPHAATKLVTVLEATQKSDGVHVRARLDAPSQDGSTQELETVVPTATWTQTKTLWACYPPSDPKKGELRTPLDPACSELVASGA